MIFSSSFVASPLRFLNEDTFLCILQYLRISDFVHLTALSRDFNELLGPVSQIRRNWECQKFVDILHRRTISCGLKCAKYSLLITWTKKDPKLVQGEQFTSFFVDIKTR